MCVIRCIVQLYTAWRAITTAYCCWNRSMSFMTMSYPRSANLCKAVRSPPPQWDFLISSLPYRQEGKDKRKTKEKTKKRQRKSKFSRVTRPPLSLRPRPGLLLVSPNASKRGSLDAGFSCGSRHIGETGLGGVRARLRPSSSPPLLWLRHRRSHCPRLPRGRGPIVW